jgi:calcineurin-like phosphoesterase family protein
MTTWFTSDHHFGHKNIKEYENRPDNWPSLAVDRWNEVVKDDDTVVHLGDFALSSIDYAREVCSWLKGKKIIFLGNHDRSKSSMLDIGFDEAYGNRKQAKYGEFQYWTRYTVLCGGQNVPLCLSHAPLEELKGYSRLNIHGHIHSNGYPIDLMGGRKPWHVNVSVDVTDYYPISAEQIIFGGYR